MIISWDPIGGNLPIEYEVYYDTSSGFDGSERLVGVTSSNSIEDVWTNVPANTQLYYGVRSVLPGETSLFRSTRGRRIMLPPTSLMAEVNDSDRLLLQWDAGDDGQTGYEIHRSSTVDFGDGEAVAEVPSNVNSWEDSTAVAGQTYFYRVRRVHSSPSAPPSDFSGIGSGQRAGVYYADYVQKHGLTGDNAIQTNDPDGDGDATFFEWGVGGTDPLSGGARPSVLVRDVQVDAEMYSALCYLRIVNGGVSGNGYEVQGLRYECEGSAGLENWSLQPVPADPPSGLPEPPLGYEWGCFRLPGSVEEYPNGFLQLKLSLLPP